MSQIDFIKNRTREIIAIAGIKQYFVMKKAELLSGFMFIEK